MNVDLLKKLIDENEVISFDIFDTLITRIVDNPEAVFDIIGEKYNIENFKKIRMEKQSEIGTILMQEKNYPHATLDEIYDYIKETTDIKNTDEIKKYELELENEVLFDNPDMHEIFDYAKKKNKRVVITSDMYIEYEDIKNILENCGYKTIDKIYLSATEKKAKFNGELFDLLIEQENVSPNKILHIGDNYDHDYILAQNKGINSYHYKNTKIERKGKNLVQSFHNGICRLIKLRNKDFFVGFGANGGLLYYSIYKELLKKNKNKYIFIARDGYNMKKLFDKYTDKETEYLYASRRSMLLGSIDKIDEDSIAILPPFTFGQTIKEILEFICMDNIFTIDEIKKVGFKSFDDEIKDINDMNNFKKLYHLEEDKVLEVCKKEREAAKKYFSKIKILDKEDFIFDCGWNGSSQYMLENLINKISNKTKIEFFYTGIFDNAKSRKQLSNSNYSTYLFDIDNNVEIANKLREDIAVVELFFGAPHNSVYKYEKDSYVLDDFENDFKYKEDILKGLEEYFKIIIEVEKKYNLKIEKEDILDLLTTLIENPTEEESINVGNIKNVDSFAGKKGEQKFIAKVTMEQLNKNENTEIYWKKALLKRPDIDEEVKEFVKKKYNLEEQPIQVIPRQSYLSRVKQSLRRNGYRSTLHIIYNKFKNKLVKQDDYKQWIKENEKDIYKVEEQEYNPKISIVVPVYNAISSELVACIDSVLNQTYNNWELCLVDDASTKEETIETLKKYENTDERIKIQYNKVNGHISKTTNDGIKLSTGEFIALLDNDDILAPNALYEMVKALNKDKKLDFIYSDEDKLSVDGTNRHDPFFKPDWSPNTFMSLMYTCHFSIFRKSLLEKIGGFTVGLDGAQDYDLVIRVSENTNRIHHIPKMLYHWREREGSIASDPEAKKYALKAIVDLKEKALKRRKQKGNILYEQSVYQYRVVYEDNNNISIIIKVNDIDNTKRLIKQLENKESNIENIILISKKKISLDTKLKYKIEKDYPKAISTKYVLFIDDSIEITNKFINILKGQASINNIGCVGPKILYKNTNLIYSVGKNSSNSNILNGYDDTNPIYYCRNRLDYDTYSLSNKCFLTTKDNYKELIKNDLDISYFNKLNKYNVVRNDCKVYINEDYNRIISISNNYDPFINNNIDTDFNIKKKYKMNNLIPEDSIKTIDNNNYYYNINITKENNTYNINGYCYKKGINNNKNNIQIIFSGKDNYSIKTNKIFNRELTYKLNDNLDFVYFNTSFNNTLKGEYKIYLKITNTQENINEIIDTKEKIKL